MNQWVPSRLVQVADWSVESGTNHFEFTTQDNDNRYKLIVVFVFQPEATVKTKATSSFHSLQSLCNSPPRTFTSNSTVAAVVAAASVPHTNSWPGASESPLKNAT
jgi:hypothetical protein